MTISNHQYYLEQALQEARKAFLKDEVPIGAVVVGREGKIIGRGFNQTDTTKDATRHAELIAIKKAANKIGDWRLDDMRLYVTVEPCLMCLGAALLSRVSEIHFVVDDPTFGSLRSVLQETAIKGAYKNTRFIQHQELKEEVAGLMKEFFDKLRKKKK